MVGMAMDAGRVKELVAEVGRLTKELSVTRPALQRLAGLETFAEIFGFLLRDERTSREVLVEAWEQHRQRLQGQAAAAASSAQGGVLEGIAPAMVQMVEDGVAALEPGDETVHPWMQLAAVLIIGGTVTDNATIERWTASLPAVVVVRKQGGL